MTHEQLVERVARTISRKLPLDGSVWTSGHGHDFPLEYSGGEQENIRTISALAIAAIREALQEPTEGMLDAYWHQAGESKEMRSRTHGYARRYLQAMLAASPLEPTK